MVARRRTRHVGRYSCRSSLILPSPPSLATTTPLLPLSHYTRFSHHMSLDLLHFRFVFLSPSVLPFICTSVTHSCNLWVGASEREEGGTEGGLIILSHSRGRRGGERSDVTCHFAVAVFCVCQRGSRKSLLRIEWVVERAVARAVAKAFEK